MSRFIIILKSYITNRGYMAVCILAFVFLLLAGHISLPDPDNTQVGLLFLSSDDDSMLISGLEDSLFDFQIVDSEDRLLSLVEDGTLECGFIFPEDMARRIQDRSLRYSITCITSPFSIKSEVVKESISAALLSAMSPYILEEAGREIFGADHSDNDPDDHIDNRSVKPSISDKPVQLDLFDTVVVDVSSSSDRPILSDLSDNRAADISVYSKSAFINRKIIMIALCIIITSAIIILSHTDDRNKAYYDALEPGVRLTRHITSSLCAGIIPGLLCTAAMMIGQIL